tara:strand:+ start:317 stop:535 length:219 start_codon:yes stop_codon:yes gene_type:complete
VSKITAKVEALAKEIGKYITPIINTIKNDGGTFSKNRMIDDLFKIPIKSKHPDAISQNLVGIKKYAAGWLVE